MINDFFGLIIQNCICTRHRSNVHMGRPGATLNNDNNNNAKICWQHVSAAKTNIGIHLHYMNQSSICEPTNTHTHTRTHTDLGGHIII